MTIEDAGVEHAQGVVTMIEERALARYGEPLDSALGKLFAEAPNGKRLRRTYDEAKLAAGFRTTAKAAGPVAEVLTVDEPLAGLLAYLQAHEEELAVTSARSLIQRLQIQLERHLEPPPRNAETAIAAKFREWAQEQTGVDVARIEKTCAADADFYRAYGRKVALPVGG
jgi:acetylornithine deacetylase/succinyl-diaminopimelate desuccinylase-like protein